MAEKLTDEQLRGLAAAYTDTPVQLDVFAMLEHIDALNAEIAGLAQTKKLYKDMLELRQSKIEQRDKTIRIYGAVVDDQIFVGLTEACCKTCKAGISVRHKDGPNPDHIDHKPACPVPAALKRKGEIENE